MNECFYEKYHDRIHIHLFEICGVKLMAEREALSVAVNVTQNGAGVYSCLKYSRICHVAVNDWKLFNFRLLFSLRRQFTKFVDSPYYSWSELCGGAVTVSLSKYLPWQAMHFLQSSTHFLKTCCRPLITTKFVSELTFHGWKNPEIAWGEI
jgi:hypothetical protein